MDNFLVNGKCPPSCGKCCTSLLPLSENEINNIKTYIGEHNITPINRNSSALSTTYIDICPFLNSDNNKCTIYEARPEICRHFTCATPYNYKQFNHEDKNIVNLIEIFCENSKVYNKPFVFEINRMYQSKKELAYGSNKQSDNSK